MMRERTGELAIRITVIIILALSLTGCTTRVIPPLPPVDPVSIYLTDYGRHSSIVLPATDGGFDEYAFGDWAYFARNQTGWPVVIHALIGSPQSTLGRRHIPPEASMSIGAALGARRLITLTVPRQRAEALHAQLESRFGASDEKPIQSDYSGLYHIRDNERYWAGNNCNHVTASWLRELGSEIRGPAIFSNFVVESRGTR